MLGGLDLTIPQVKTLSPLEARGPPCMSSMAFLVDRTVSAMTSIVDRLVEKGLIARPSDATDRRRVVCTFTTKGELTIINFWRIDRGRMQMVVDAMTDDQLLAAITGLGAIRDAEIEIQQEIAVLLPYRRPTPPEP